MNGKIVAITGANGRLGSRFAARFAERGARIAAIVRSQKSADGLHGPNLTPFVADLTDEAAVAACFQQIHAHFGTLDALLHTAGGWDGRPFLDTTLADWQRLVDGNLTSAFLCFREAARLMAEKGGRLIGIASGQGADKGRARQGAYSASKGGLIRLVEAIAEEYAGTGLTAHAIAPSSIRYNPDEVAAQGGVDANHLADLALYLCSEAGTSLNGATLRAYGS